MIYTTGDLAGNENAGELSDNPEKIEGAKIMQGKVSFDYTKASKFISEEEVSYMKGLALAAKDTLVSRNGAGNDFLG